VTISVVQGPQGGGKSLYGAWLLAQMVEFGSYDVCATNMECTPLHPAFDELVALGDEDAPVWDGTLGFWDVLPDNSFVVIDEADIFFHNSESRDLAKTSARLFFKQHRKRRFDIVLIVQEFEQLWNLLRSRSFTQEFVVCECDSVRMAGDWRARMVQACIPRSAWRFRRWVYSVWPPRKAPPLDTGVLTFKQAREIYGWYRTEQLISQAAGKL